MENNRDIYLHKKFKKQTNIDYSNRQKCDETNVDSNHQKCDAEKENVEKSKLNTVDEKHAADALPHTDNKEKSVNSTNETNLLLLNSATKSSISVEPPVTNVEPSDPCISHDYSCSDSSANLQADIFERTSAAPSNNQNFRNLNFVNEQDISFSQKMEIKYNMKNKISESAVDLKTNEKCNEVSKIEDTSATPDRSTGGKYICTYCNLGCSKPSVLQKHIRAHTNERPYPCISCGFSFKTRSNLYKHCRSRTHANRVMESKGQDNANNEGIGEKLCDQNKSLEYKADMKCNDSSEDLKLKPYKPRFHTNENLNVPPKINNMTHDYSNHINNTAVSLHANEVIGRNHVINPVNLCSPNKQTPKPRDDRNINRTFNMKPQEHMTDEPLNLTNKCRKRCVSELQEPIIQKSLIKELLLKNLYADSNMQCPHCKMIFQTVTEFELHKMRSCKGFSQPGMKFTRSSSVNVASILTHNKNAFDSIPHLQDTVFHVNSPGPFLGKTRLVEFDRAKSFSFEDVLPNSTNKPPYIGEDTPWPQLDLQTEKEKKPVIKLFGGELKITKNRNETESFKIDDKVLEHYNEDTKLKEYSSHVIKSGLQSGGTVLANKGHFNPEDNLIEEPNRPVYKNTVETINPEINELNKPRYQFTPNIIKEPSPQLSKPPQTTIETQPSVKNKYLDIADFTQKAVKLLAPNLKCPDFNVLGVTAANKSSYHEDHTMKSHTSVMHRSFHETEKDADMYSTPPSNKQKVNVILPEFSNNNEVTRTPVNLYDPLNVYVNGKIIRYVPGIPGPLTGEDPVINTNIKNADGFDTNTSKKKVQKSDETMHCDNKESEKTIAIPTTSKSRLEPHGSEASDLSEDKNEVQSTTETSIHHPKFVRPNSLALKPSAACFKQHHGLTPTIFNQILISPDTPRVAKKYVQQFLNGNYFSYLGLKSSTRSVYCTLNKTQPFYTPHFKKLSMYSEWRQQDNKIDKLFASAYDSRQKQQNYSTAGQIVNLLVHSNYKFILSEIHSIVNHNDKEKSNTEVCAYESKDDYIYIRGRGRGRYMCSQCGIRCKKPSMLKKHIRTHSNDRPYTCAYCNFSFKTKGNLTKHMKSKAHTKNTSTGSNTNSICSKLYNMSSESEAEDSGMDSSDESTRQQEHEAAYGLLTLSQKTTQNLVPNSQTFMESSCSLGGTSDPALRTHPLSDVVNIMNTEEIVHVTKINYAKNKILDEQKNFTLPTKTTLDILREAPNNVLPNSLPESDSTARPLTYPYMSAISDESKIPKMSKDSSMDAGNLSSDATESQSRSSPWELTSGRSEPLDNVGSQNNQVLHQTDQLGFKTNINGQIVDDCNPSSERKKRKSIFDNTFKDKIKRNETVIDLSIGSIDKESSMSNHFTTASVTDENSLSNLSEVPIKSDFEACNSKSSEPGQSETSGRVGLDYKGLFPKATTNSHGENSSAVEYDNSAMETLADVATKQVKLEKNILARNVASEYLKLTKGEHVAGDTVVEGYNLGNSSKDVSDLIVKPEGNKCCTICAKNFNKSSHLRLHMNIHYLERPFRCGSCSVSFRTKGHLQKHERSASHHNKLTSSPALLSAEPRPFKCTDCSIAFRIHGHLAKHLRSKMHIMKLECLAKIPFGLYAELERSNSLLTEINTVDGEQCLESLKILAKKVFTNDPEKLTQLNPTHFVETDR